MTDKLIEAATVAAMNKAAELGLLDGRDNPKILAPVYALIVEAALRAVRECQWQPIESAPRDGTTIIGYGRRWLHPTKYDIDKIRWISDEDIIEFEGFATGQLAFAPRDGESGKKLMSFGVDDFFTHWMPLPTPPQEGK